MSDSNVNERDTAATPRQVVQIQTRKRIVGYEEDNNPASEPLFANHFELFQIGTDVYLDIGIVYPEDIVNLKPTVESAPSELHTLTFNVLQRVAMSRDGFDRLRAGVETIMKGEQKVARQD
jgi:hypothetical protein